MYVTNSKLTKLTLNRCKNCRGLPSLGQLPSLEISKLDGLEIIDFVFFNKNSGSFQHETPFKSLEKLIIKDMSSWSEWHFPQEFDGFPQLRILEIRRCPVLRGDLPAHLPALEELMIDGCEELACSLPRAPKLHQLYVHDDFFDVAEPHSVAIFKTRLAMSVLECMAQVQPPRVQRMKIGGCRSPISLSADYLPASLQYLQIYWCPELTIPEPLQHKWLTEIELAGSGSLMFLLVDLPNLKKLRLSDCKNMEYFEVPHALPSLLYLTISRCQSLLALGRAAPCLEHLRIEDCPEIDCFAEECLPSNLKKLVVFGCDKLAGWIASTGLQNQGLTHLQLIGCKDVKSFPREGCLPASLESLKLRALPNLETLDCKGLHHLTSLKHLQIYFCENLENIIEEHLLASIETIYIGEECPLRTKLEDPRIQFISDSDDEYDI